MTKKKKEYTTYPVGPLSYTRTVQALKEALSQEFSSYGLDPTERSVRRLFWRDNMEDYPVNKWLLLTGVPKYVTDIPAFEGDYVLSLNNPVGEYADCRVQFGMFPNLKNSVELAWYKDPNLRRVWLEIDIRNGSVIRRVGVCWNKDVDRWEYGTSTGTYTAVPGGGEKIDSYTWNYLRLVGDWKNNVYSRLMTTGLDIDMSGIPMASNPSTDCFSRVVLGKLSWGVNQPAYFDDVRVYLNEE